MMWAIAQIVLAAASAAALLLAYRWMQRRAPWAALAYALGLLARLTIGVGFALSWLAAAPGPERLGPDSRWFPDAQMYFAQATDAAATGLTSVDDGDASPVFVRGLALWMRAAGGSHGAAHLLNLLIYAGLSVGIVGVLTRRRDDIGRTAAAVVVGATALSPNLIMLASQPLKDTVFFGGVALVVLALLVMLVDDDRAIPRVALSPLPLVSVFAGAYLVSGMRAYYGLLMLGLLAGMLALRGTWLAIGTRRVPWRYGGGAVLVLAALWAGCRFGGGPYYDSLVEPVLAPVATRLEPAVAAARRALGLPPPADTGQRSAGGLGGLIGRSRRGFELTVGATNMTPPELDPSRRTGYAGQLRGLALGLAAVFVPVTVLRASGMVSFPGGGTLLYLTDVDTLILDVSLVICLVFSWRHRQALRPHLTVAAFVLALGIVSALLVGYVVTNYGTLYRLRLMAVVPLWLLPLAMAPPARTAPQAAA